MDATTAVTVAASKELVKKADPYLALLIKPAFKTIGEEWDTRLKEKFAAARAEKQANNLQHHIEKGEKIAATRPQKRKSRKKATLDSATEKEAEAAPPSASVDAINGVEKWMEAARDVDPEDQTAPIWQELLADLFNHENVDLVVIETLRQMKAVELRALLRLRFSLHKGSVPDYGCEKALIEKGLVVKRPHRLLGAFLATGGLAFFTLLLDIMLLGRLADRSLSSLHLDLGKITTMSSLAIIGISCVSSCALFMLNSFSLFVLKPTWLGQEIIQRAIEAGVNPHEDN